MLYAGLFMAFLSVGIISMITLTIGGTRRIDVFLDMLSTIVVFAIAGMMLYKMIESLIK